MNQRRELPVRNPYPRNPQAARSGQDRYPEARDQQGRPGQNRPPRGPDGPRGGAGGRSGGGSGAMGTAQKTKWLRAGKALLALVSVLILGISGYSWAQTNGINKADVIDPNAQNATGEQNILLVGLDNRTDAQGNPLPQSLLDQLHAGSSSDGGDNTDTMILIHIPAGGGQAVAFSIPRDSYVQLAGGYGMHKINSAYTYAQVAADQRLRAQGVSGSQLAVQADAAGAQNAIHTVQNLTGLTINHFASVNLVGFYSISNAIGGVPVCLKHAVHDSYSGANFAAGPTTVQGASALAFVRQRHGLPLGDIDRIRRQQAFMASMAHTVLSAGVLTDPSKLNALIKAIQGAITIDSNWDIFSFAQEMANMSGGKIQFTTVPIVNITYPTPQDGDAVEVSPAQIKQFISQTIAAQNGTPSTSAAPPQKSTANTKANNASVTAEVLNGSGKTGLAGKVESLLTSQGYSSGGTGNTSARTSSVVEYGSGGSTGAQQVASALGGLRTESDSSLPQGHVRVLLGTSYNGPTTASGSSGGSTSSSGGGTPTSSQAPAGATPTITANGVTCVD